MLTDAIDGTLSPTDQAAFDRHIASCDVCTQMLADAQRGAALLEMLKSPRPDPSSTLLERILDQTSGIPSQNAALPAAQSGSHIAGLEIHSILPQPLAVAGATVPNAYAAPYSAKILPFRARMASRFTLHNIGQTMLQPRLAMTAAMAFFSIALTLNLTGVHVSQLRASDLKASSLKRSFYEADASVVRYYDNLRVVYELESRVRDLQRSNDEENAPSAPKPGSKAGSAIDKDHPQKPKPTPRPGSGTSQKRDPLQQQLKLASIYDRRQPLQLSQLSVVSANPASRNTKFKEETQEGGLV
jgi:hypothetical protein